MKAVLIDPFTRSVSEIDIDPSLDNLYQTLQVDTITVVAIRPDHALIIDDEGLLKSRDEQEYFWWAGSEQPFAGRGLILKDEMGENRDAAITVEQVKKCMRFCDKEEINPEDYLGWTITTF